MSRTGLLLALLSTAAHAGAWVVAPRPHGEVTFKIEGPLDDVPGVTRSITGNLEFDEKDWAKGKGLVSVQLDTLRTGIDQRDQDMRIEFLETARFPYALLAIERIERPSAAAIAPGQSVQGEAVGSFEVHGVRRAIRIAITLELKSATELWVKGGFEVPLSDYAISRPSRLFLKLGETVDATFHVRFQPKEGQPAPPPEVAVGAPPPPSAPTVAEVKPAAAKAKPRPVKKKIDGKPTLLFAGADDLKGRGEKLFHATDVGGVGNTLSCYHCHAKIDERQGFNGAGDKYARQAGTVYNSAQRGVFWGGLATDVGAASSICQRKFMGGEGLGGQQRKELKAFLEALSPDPAPPLYYAALYKTMESPIANPTGGDVLKGKAASDRFCANCHEGGRAAPVFLQGLYDPEWIVRRVRWLEGHQSKGCPPTSMLRLPDSDLRDIVTYLAGPAAGGRPFEKKK
jgi:polyisoprenoid-binding protein YceI/mono/diheme cytochrome c family protein